MCKRLQLPLTGAALLTVSAWAESGGAAAEVHRAEHFDVSAPLGVMLSGPVAEPPATPPRAPAGVRRTPPPTANREQAPAAAESAPARGAEVEQTTQGARPAAVLLKSFDGLGAGFEGPQGTAVMRNPSDNTLAVGPDHIVQIVNSRMAVFTKEGKPLYGPVPTNAVFKGFGGQCEPRPNGDAVVRYDQLAKRWLIVMPIFRRSEGESGTYAMCYAVSAGPDLLGPYYRYEFKRDLFPDYPRPAVWPDGYYIPTSTGDTVIQKHACVADRAKMLQGLPATEQCVIIDGVNFLNNADVDGTTPPPAGAPNIMMAAGGAQLKKIFEDDGICVWKFHVDWEHPENTKAAGPEKIAVAPYHYLCNGQLTNCVPQPGTDRRLDAQGDKIMQRLVYRNLGGHEAVIAVHSVNTAAGGGGVRWYEFRLDKNRDVHLYQQGTYAPDKAYRWMASGGMDRQGNIAMGYSYGGPEQFAGQRFAGRLAGDPLGKLTLHETVLAEGEAPQTNTLRWEDYTTAAMDPSDDCTFWYVGDYMKKGAANYSTRIGAFRLPGCLRAVVSGSVYRDLNGNGQRDPGEPGLAKSQVEYTGPQSGKITTDASGNFTLLLPADPAYGDPTYKFTAAGVTYTVQLQDREQVTGVDFGVGKSRKRK